VLRNQQLFVTLYAELHRSPNASCGAPVLQVRWARPRCCTKRISDNLGPRGHFIPGPGAVHGLFGAGHARPDHRLRARPPGAEAGQRFRDHFAQHRHCRGLAEDAELARIGEALDELATVEPALRLEWST
jgi:hypothetical protein